MIYLDNAATTIDKDESVTRAISNSLMSKKYGNPSRGSYEISTNSLKKLMEIRMTIANFFGTNNPLKVVLTPNITFALNFIIKSILKENDHVITSITEHNSVLRPLYEFENRGGEISFIDIDDEFNLKLTEIEKYIKENTKAIIITAASNVSGNVTDLEKVYEICKKHSLKLIIDGAQIAGTVEFSLKNFDNTIFAFTGHKGLHGPGGTGGFIVKGDFDFNQVFAGGSGFDSFSKTQPQKLPELFEPGTSNIHSFIGLEAAIKNIEKNKPFDRLDYLTRLLYKELKKNKNLEFYTFLKNKNSPIVSFNIEGIDANTVGQILDEEYGVCSRSGAHCAPLFHKRVNTEKRGILRLSLSHYNTEEEIYKVAKAVNEIANSR
ncbi:cysteine desulfurase family protein [Peptoniphilus olsenii]|uniref:Cysteine desulfurase family protein n=1 Tax=Peptoniphilus olsenii TaxID=411570 RepID=A0ABV2JCN6_9FIRM